MGLEKEIKRGAHEGGLTPADYVLRFNLVSAMVDGI